MKVFEVIETDLIAKAFAITPTVENPDMIPTTVSIVNAFGGVSMKIRADLNPIELMYLVESEHDIKWTQEGWIIDMHLMDIVNHVPNGLLQEAYENSTGLVDILRSRDTLTMLGNSFSAEAHQRFRTNRFVNMFTTPDTIGPFEGWTLHLIGLKDSGKMICPMNPETRVQNELQLGFEQALTAKVGDIFSDWAQKLTIIGVFNKRVSYSELVDLVKSEFVSVKNIGYGIGEMIERGYVTDDMYEITQQKRVNGTFFENIEFDLEPVLKVLEEDALFPVTVISETDYTFHFTETAAPMMDVNIRNNFDRYISMVMNTNVMEAGQQFTPPVQAQPDPTVPPPATDEEREEMMAPFKDTAEQKDELVYEEDLDSDDAQDQVDLEEAIDDDIDFAEALVDALDEETNDDGESNLSNLEDTQPVAAEETTEEVPPPAEPERKMVESEEMEFSFFVCNGTFDDIKRIESNQEYHKPGTMGIICMDPDANGVPQTYYLGRLAPSESGGIVRFRWDVIDHDKMFQTTTPGTRIGYKVKDWYANGKEAHDVLWVDHKDYEIGGTVNELQ